MKARTFLVLLAVAIAVAVAAAVTVIRDQRPAGAQAAGEKLFPGLLDRVDGLAKIVVRDAQRTLTVERRDGRWLLVERRGYPVRLDRVREVVLGLAGLERVETKTTRPDLYPRLQVEDPSAPDAKSKKVELIDGEGRPIAQLIVGSVAFDLGAQGGLYARKPDEERAWLVAGRLSVGAEPREWVERRIVDLPADQVKEVRIVRPGGETITARKDAPQDEHLALKDLPGGAKPARSNAADPLASVLTALDLDDVQPAEAIPFAADKTTRVRVTTFDGRVVTLDLTEHDGGKWLRLAAEAGSSGGGGGQAAAESAHALTERAAGWAYHVPSWKVAPFEQRRADLLDTQSGGS